MRLELLHLDQTGPEHWHSWCSLLTPEELSRAARYRQEEDRRAFIAGRGTVRQHIAALAGLAPKAVELYTGPTGKPFAKGLEREVQFNISHSGSLLAIAFSTTGVPVGVDIEQVRPHFDYTGILKHYFTKAECAEICSPIDFFRFWTMKEAFLKATGTALMDGLAQLDFSSSQTAVPIFASDLADWKGQAFVLHSYSHTNWVMTLAHPAVEEEVAFGAGCAYRQKTVQL